MSFVTLSDITKQYRMGDIIINANDKVSFDIEKGEFAIIVGPSGSGKTTVLNILGGMDTATSGSFYVDGSKISGYSRKELIDYRRYDIGFIFQFYNLIPNLTAKENIELSTQTVEDYIPAVEILEKVGLTDRINNFPAQLSGGEQQRVAIARALAKKPKLLLLDEHTAALDPKTAAKVLALTEKIVTRDQLTTLMITHNMRDALRYGNRLIMLHNGRVIIDVKGEEKQHLQIADLLDMFEKASGSEMASDRLLLG